MKIYKDTTRIVEVLVGIKCDCCNQVYDDQMDVQEFMHYHDIGGFSSVFGDGCEIDLDLCQRCVKEILGRYIRLS